MAPVTSRRFGQQSGVVLYNMIFEFFEMLALSLSLRVEKSAPSVQSLLLTRPQNSSPQAAEGIRQIVKR